MEALITDLTLPSTLRGPEQSWADRLPGSRCSHTSLQLFELVLTGLYIIRYIMLQFSSSSVYICLRGKMLANPPDLLINHC